MQLTVVAQILLFLILHMQNVLLFDRKNRFYNYDEFELKLKIIDLKHSFQEIREQLLF